MSRRAQLRELIWCVPPYIGVLISTVILNIIDSESHSRVYMGIIGALLILPFVTVQNAILHKKIPLQRAIVFGFVGPGLLWLVGNLIVGALIAARS